MTELRLLLLDPSPPPSSLTTGPSAGHRRAEDAHQVGLWDWAWAAPGSRVLGHLLSAMCRSHRSCCASTQLLPLPDPRHPFPGPLPGCSLCDLGPPPPFPPPVSQDSGCEPSGTPH